MIWLPQDANLLPVDRTTGGLARFIGWIDQYGIVVDTPDDGTLVIERDKWITSVPVTGGVAISPVTATPQRTYTAGVTSDGFIAISLLWVMEDGSVVYGAGNVGIGRVAVTATAPLHSVGSVVEIAAPTIRVTSQGKVVIRGNQPFGANAYGDGPYGGDQPSSFSTGLYGTGLYGAGPYGGGPPQYALENTSYWNRAAIMNWAIGADPTAGLGPITLTSPIVVGFPTDPGPLDPQILDTRRGTRLYQSLPAFMRKDDINHILRDYLLGVGSPEDTTSDIAETIFDGALTNPDIAPDEWIPWLAAASGVPVKDVVNTRALLQAQALAPAVGTRAAIAALARQFLTGTKVADVFPGSNQWQIAVRVKSNEMRLVTNEAGLAAAMMATGQVPAGYYLTVVSGLPTWQSIDAASTHWADIDKDSTWDNVDSTNVTGI